MTRRVIVIIPARGGSKGIPRKNLRIFNGRPLVEHAIEIARSATTVSQVIVSSDDSEILELAERCGVSTFKRNRALASDQATLDVVIEEVVKAFQLSDEIVVTLQATCPLVLGRTIDRAVMEIEAYPKATSFTVVENRHLTWLKEDEKFIANYEKRLNRQELQPFFTETGGVVACLGAKISKYHTRFFGPYKPISVSEIEGIDIDTSFDWAKAEMAFRQKRIAVFVTGNQTKGLGHLYRQLSLYDHFAKHDVCFFCTQEDTLVHKMLTSKFIKVETFDEKSVGNLLVDFQPNIIINDLLDAWTDLIDIQRATNAKIIIFETEVHEPDLEHEVINALYPFKYNNDRVGPSWFMLRPEFMSIKPRSVTEKVSEIVVTFGGADPSDQSMRLYNILSSKVFQKIHCTVVLGKGYNGELLGVKSSHNFEIVRDTTQISSYMARADLAITSKGRTIYELAKCGVPLLAISQNDREMRHHFGKVVFEDLGLHSEVSDAQIESALLKIISDVSLRRNMSLNNTAIPFDGIRNIIKLIEE